MKNRELAQLCKSNLISLRVASNRAYGATKLIEVLDRAGFAIVPKEPTEEAVQRGVDFALKAQLSNEYPWTSYIRDIYKAITKAAANDRERYNQPDRRHLIPQCRNAR